MILIILIAPWISEYSTINDRFTKSSKSRLINHLTSLIAKAAVMNSVSVLGKATNGSVFDIEPDVLIKNSTWP